MPFQNPVIVLPGVTGTSLIDEYPVDAQPLWTVLLNNEYARLALHPDDPRFEAKEPARVVPGQLFKVIYGDLVAALRHDLTVHADRPTPVFAFPYDWRQPVQASARLLADFIDEVIDRTSLLRHYARWPATQRKVDLVGHSMGGLVICEYLVGRQLAGIDPRVRKVATLGAPHRGSVEAVVKLATGLASLGGETPSERERELARSTPAIYQLLPTFEGAVRNAPSDGLLAAENWQRGIIDSLAEYVRLRAVEPPSSAAALRTRGRQLLQTFLDQTSELRQRADLLRPMDLGLTEDSWLTVVGIDADTRTTLAWKATADGPRFEFPDPVNNVGSGKTGDGTVPLASAVPPFLAPETMVAVRPDDFDVFELRDRALAKVAGFHAQLPNMNLAQRLVLRHLRHDYRGNTKGRPIPGVSRSDWEPPIPRKSPSVPNGISLS